MLKRVGLMAVLLSAANVAHASMTLPAGFYLGANVAGVVNTVSNQLTFNPDEVEFPNLYYRSFHGSTAVIQPGFVIGYEHLFNRKYFFSAEIQANFLKSYANLGGADYISNEIVINNHYAAQVRVGTPVITKDNFVYGIFGLSCTMLASKATFNNAVTDEGTLGHLQLTDINAAHNYHGFKFGIGYERHVNKSVAWRFDYSHTWYGSGNFDLTDMVFASILPNLGKSNIGLSTDMLSFTVMMLS